MNAATTIGAARAAARRRIVRHLRKGGATSERDAVPLDPGRFVHRRALEGLVRAGAVGDAGGGRYWLNELGYGDYMRGVRKRVFAAAGLALTLAGLGILFGR